MLFSKRIMVAKCWRTSLQQWWWMEAAEAPFHSSFLSLADRLLWRSWTPTPLASFGMTMSPEFLDNDGERCAADGEETTCCEMGWQTWWETLNFLLWEDSRLWVNTWVKRIFECICASEKWSRSWSLKSIFTCDWCLDRYGGERKRVERKREFFKFLFLVLVV